MGNNQASVQMKQTEQRYYAPSAMIQYEESSKKEDGTTDGTAHVAKVKHLTHTEENPRESDFESAMQKSVDFSKNNLQPNQQLHVNSPDPGLIKSTQADDKNQEAMFPEQYRAS